MRFKLLHIRPHVWFLKQQEPCGKATSDDSSNDGSASAFKRSVSLKLVKSDGKLRTAKSLQRQAKDVQVCTVVDAGCTCRATVTSSQQKQKKALLAGDPRLASEAGEVYAGDKYAVCRPRRATYSGSSKSRVSNKSSSSMVSRLVCKTSDDVVHKDGDCAYYNTKDTTKLQRSSVTNMSDTMTFLNVHALECKLRKAGLEDRSSRKKHGDGGPSFISSGVSISSGSRDTMTDTCNTIDTSEMQEIVMSSNPEYGMVDDTDYSGSMDMSLEDLRASIAETKLDNRELLSKQARLFNSKETGRVNEVSSPESGMNTSTCSSPVSNGSFLDGSFRRRAAKPDHGTTFSDLAHGADQGDGQESVKHVDGCGVVNRHYIRKADLNGISPQHHKLNQLKAWHSDDSITLDDSDLPSTASERRVMSGKKNSNAQNQGTYKNVTVIPHVNPVREDHGSDGTRIISTMQGNAYNQSSDGRALLNGSISGQQYGIISDDRDGRGSEDKRVVSSSSCEIQVLSDYTTNIDSNTMRYMHGVALSSSPSPSISPGMKKGLSCAATQAESTIMTRSNSGGAVAMVKSSYDPRHDFKESMLEMVVAKQLQGPRQLQQLLQCYLSLNPSHYHSTIIEVFHELCSELFT